MNYRVRILSTLDLAKEERAAFEALPAPYQGDNCLNFWKDSDGVIWAAPKKDQESVLGVWESTYDPATKEWWV